MRLDPIRSLALLLAALLAVAAPGPGPAPSPARAALPAPPPVDLSAYADTGVDCADALQAILDGPTSIVVLPPATYTLSRPLVIRKDGARIEGLPWATLKTTGGFPALMPGFPKPSRRPGFAEAHRVAGPAAGYFAYRLAKDRYLSLRATQFEFGPGKNWGELDAITIAFAVRRERADINNEQDSVLCTDPAKGSADPLNISIQGRRHRLTVRTADGVERHLDILTPVANRDSFIVAAIDFASGTYQAYADGVAAEVRPNVPWSPGLRVRWPDLSDCMLGKSPLTGPSNLTVYGMKLTPKITVAMGVPIGTPIARVDGKTGSDGDPAGFASFLWDRHHQGEVILDMRQSSVVASMPDLVPVRGGGSGEKRGFGYALPANWGPYDIIADVAVRNLTIRTGDEFQGAALQWGTCLGLRLCDLDLYGGLIGIVQLDPVTSYVTRLERIKTNGQGDCGIALGYGIVRARDLTIGTGGAPRSRSAIKNRSSTGEICDVFVSEMSSVETVFRIGGVMGHLDLTRINTDWESHGPYCYVRADRGQTGPGRDAVLHLREFGASRPPRDGGPYIRLADPFNGRTDLGGARLILENSLEVAGAGPLCEAAGVWTMPGAVEVRGRMAAGIVTPTPGPEDPTTTDP